MFSHLRVASKCIRRPPQRVSTPHSRRITTTPVRASLAPEPPSEAEIALKEAIAEQETHDKEEEYVLSQLKDSPEERRQPETYNEFMEEMGNGFKYADAPRKWLGGNEAVEFVPFVPDSISAQLLILFM
jgi:hypothetical protein